MSGALHLDRPEQYQAFKGLLARLRIGAAILVLLAYMVIWTIPAQANPATPGYDAFDVLGQTKDETASFSHKFQNNWEAPNASGVSESWFQALDEVDHRLFVSDCKNQRVLVYNLDNANRPLDNEADFVLGQANFTDPPMLYSQNQNQFGGCVYGVAYDAGEKRLFVAEGDSFRVLVFDLAGGITNGMNASYVIGQDTFGARNFGEGQNRFRMVTGLAYDAADKRLFVSDSGNRRVMVFDLSSGITNGMNASNVLGHNNFGYVPGTGAGPATAATMENPMGLAYDSANKRLFVAVPSDRRVMVFDLTAGITDGMNAVNAFGQPVISGSGSDSFRPCSASSMGWPVGVSYSGTTQRLAVGEAYCGRTLIFDTAGGITNGMNATVELGKSSFTASYDSTNWPSQSYASTPYGVSWGNNGELLYINDFQFNRILGYDLSSGGTNGMNASYILGQTDAAGGQIFTKKQRNDGQVWEKGFDHSDAIALDDKNHRLFVADDNNRRVLVYNLNDDNTLPDYDADFVLGKNSMHDYDPSYAATRNNVVRVAGMTYDTVHDRLFMSDVDNQRVLIFDLAGGISNGMDASYVLGQREFDNIEYLSSGPNTLNTPTTLAYDEEGQRLFVSDRSFRIMVFDLANGISNGMDASNVLGQANFTDMEGPWQSPTSASTFNSQGLAYDSVEKRLFAGDIWSCRILVFNVASGITNGMDAANVLGQPNFTSDQARCSGGPQADALPYIDSLAYDETRKFLFAVDGIADSHILGFDLSNGITNGMAASGIIGGESFTATDSTGKPPASDTLSSPGDIALAENARILFVSDTSNNRVMLFDFVHLVDLPRTTLTVDQQFEAFLAIAYQGNLQLELISGELPPGIILDGSTNRMFGAPTKSGTYTFTVKATDDNGATGKWTDTRTYTIVVTDGDINPPVPGDGGGGTVQANPGGNPVYRASASTITTAQANEGRPVDNCMTLVDLDKKPAYSEGDGYVVEVDNCYINIFTAFEPDGSISTYGAAINTVGDYFLDVTVAPIENFNRPVGHVDLVPESPETAIQPTPTSTNALGIQVTNFNPGKPTTFVKFSKLDPAEYITPQTCGVYCWLWAPLSIGAVTIILVFVWKYRKDHEEPIVATGPPDSGQKPDSKEEQ